MMRYLLIALPLSLLALSGFWLDRQSRPAVAYSPTMKSAELIFATGRVEGATQDVELHFEVSGRIECINIREGDFVEPGTVLVKLDDATEKQQLALMQSEHAEAVARRLRLKNGAHEHERLEAAAIYEARQAQLKRALLRWERNLQLHENAAITRQEFDDSQGDVDALQAETAAARARMDRLNAPAREDELQAADAQVDAATARVELAKADLEKRSLRAPSYGQIAKINGEVGEIAGNPNSEANVVLIDTRKLRVRAYIEEQDVARVRVGQMVRVYHTGNSQNECWGTVAEVSPRMSKKQAWSDRPDERFDLKTREVLIEMGDANGLVPGLSVDVEIEPETTEFARAARSLSMQPQTEPDEASTKPD